MLWLSPLYFERNSSVRRVSGLGERLVRRAVLCRSERGVAGVWVGVGVVLGLGLQGSVWVVVGNKRWHCLGVLWGLAVLWLGE